MKVRTKQGEVRNDIHVITTKWQDIPDGEWRSEYDTDPNIEVQAGKVDAAPEPKED